MVYLLTFNLSMINQSTVNTLASQFADPSPPRRAGQSATSSLRTLLVIEHPWLYPLTSSLVNTKLYSHMYSSSQNSHIDLVVLSPTYPLNISLPPSVPTMSTTSLRLWHRSPTTKASCSLIGRCGAEDVACGSSSCCAISGAAAGVGGVAFSGWERALVKRRVRGRRLVGEGMGRTWGGKGRECRLEGMLVGCGW